jgi:hypothetical protein
VNSDSTPSLSSSEFSSLAEENRALRAQVQDLTTLVQHQDAKLDWLIRIVYGAKSERRPAAQDLGTAVQENFLTLPVTAVAVDVDAAQAEAERQEALKHTDQLSAAQKRNAKKGRGADGKNKKKNGGGRRPVNRR